MNLGIFGDSFAFSGAKNKNNTLTWCEHLQLEHNIVNYSFPASSLYYSYNQFIKNYTQFDKIIFVVTQPGRLLLPERDGTELRSRCINSLSAAESEYNKEISPIRKNVLKAAIDYFLHLQNDEEILSHHSLMIDNIKRLRPDTILIPGFPDSFPGKESTSMSQIHDKENTAWGRSIHEQLAIIHNESDIMDSRYCHMIAENNGIFANEVRRWLAGDEVIINLDNFVVPSMESENFYFRKHH